MNVSSDVIRLVSPARWVLGAKSSAGVGGQPPAGVRDRGVAPDICRPSGEIHRGIEISVRHIAATGRLPVGEPQIVVDDTALQAQRRWVPAVSDHDPAVPPLLLVAQLPSELGLARIRDRLSQVVFAQHAGHVEVFDDEPVVGLDQRIGHLV